MLGSLDTPPGIPYHRLIDDLRSPSSITTHDFTSPLSSLSVHSSDFSDWDNTIDDIESTTD